jgi:bile acid:Na+ symporter, BASS family
VDQELASAVFRAGVTAAIVATVLSLGASFTVAQLAAPLARIRLVVVVVLLNTVVLPAAAWWTARALPISEGYVVGIALAAIGAGGAAGLKAAQLSGRADLPLAVSLVVVLQMVNLVSVPLWAAVVGSGADLSRLSIVANLLGLVLLPLAIGAVLRARSAAVAARLRPTLLRIGNLALLVAIVAGIGANLDVLASVLRSYVLPAAVVVTVLGLVLGLLVGWSSVATRTTTSLVSGTRFSALGLVIIGTQFADRPEVLAAAITFSLVDLVVMLAAAASLRLSGAASASGRS